MTKSAGGCWAITGQAIIIGDTAFSVMAGFECCNFNFRVDSTQAAVPTYLALKGPSTVTWGKIWQNIWLI